MHALDGHCHAQCANHNSPSHTCCLLSNSTSLASIYTVALELLRQQDNIISATTSSKHYGTADQANRDFQQSSVKSRSKFDIEAVNKFGKYEDRSEPSNKKPSKSEPTVAIVTINYSIEGDSTKLPYIRYRKDVAEALNLIAKDSQVEDCLLSAEILWAPDNVAEVLKKDDLYVDYPNLIPL
jgi:uncharacterized membrane protein